MDSMTYLVFFWVLIGAFGIGMLSNPLLRCKLMRKWLKKNYLVLNIKEKGSNRIAWKIVNADDDVVFLGTRLWIICKSRVQRKVQFGEKTKTISTWIYRLFQKGKEESGFNIEDKHISWEEGVPCIYVDADNIKPLKFYQEEANVRADEVGSSILGWVNNQRAKG